ncbi:WAT1-related protein At1g25270-like [Ipomoea triloba]|uniref:WAT1-related protein At1g25270-like n=1 Tax=Ipomoea triloba TaxID=35885 RepID=UPI00125E55F0|nr:WAT1-related protein At1g25270-like [Ipomoea triloba]
MCFRNKRTKLKWMVIFQAFCCGLIGPTLGQNLNGKGIIYASATYATAITLLTLATTFILAVTLRLERIKWSVPAGKAKVLGTIVGVCGAIVFVSYKGAEIDLWNKNVNPLHSSLHYKVGTRPVLGAFLAFLGCFCYSSWLIIQGITADEYPYPYSFTALTMVMGAIQSFVYAICVDRNWEQWKLGWDTKLLTVAYVCDLSLMSSLSQQQVRYCLQGIFGGGVMFSLLRWCVGTKGPVYVSMFNPLTVILVVVFGSLRLNEKLYLGNAFGGVVIMIGVYAVLWGKGKETEGDQ